MTVIKRSSEEYKCDNCGTEADEMDIEISISCGFGTIYDGFNMNVHLCCNCAKKFIDGKKIKAMKLIQQKAKAWSL